LSAVLSNYMKRLYLLIFITLYGLRSSALTLFVDTTARQQITLTAVDSLKQQLDSATNDTLRSVLYGQIATQYLDYDKLEPKLKKQYQAQALSYSYLALHLMSRMNDTIGQRNVFDGLAKVYRSQKKYPQAKWFILQSNTISRGIKDIPNIMSSLMVLANIKMEIKDYTLAMRDLDEALKLSKNNHYPKVESKVQESYVLLYTHLKNYAKADIAAKRRDLILDSILKEQEKLVAKTRDTLSTKKKLYQVNRKLSKPNYSRKIVSI
jgi:tetratricopeptide (TPR) repeat protein